MRSRAEYAATLVAQLVGAAGALLIATRSWQTVQTPRPRPFRADVLAVRVRDQAEKAALLAGDPERFFTEPHYNGFPAILVRLPRITLAQLRKLIFDAWRCQAPRQLVKDHEATRPGKRPQRR